MSDEELADFSLNDIDRNRLDELCCMLPKLSRYWGDKLALAREAAAIAKAELKLCAADLKIQIYQAPERFGLVKNTDTAVEAAVICHKNHQDRQQILISADYTEEQLKVMMGALNDFRSSLDNLTRLHGQQYFARVPTNPDAKASAKQQERNEQMPKTTRKKST